MPHTTLPESVTVNGRTVEFDSATNQWFEVGAVRKVISARRAVRMLAVAGALLPALQVSNAWGYGSEPAPS